MRQYLAGIDQANVIWRKYPELQIDFGLYSFWSYSNVSWRECCRHCRNILVDSGAHSFQHGAKTDFNAFVERYTRFIRANTKQPRIDGFFELDVDVVIGTERVNEIRKELDKVSDKIIPVWHPCRGIDEWYHLLETYRNRRVAVTAFLDEIYDNQFNLFINAAHKYNCRVHLLGCTKYNILKRLNLHKDDSFDSASWRLGATFGSLIVPQGDSLTAVAINNDIFKGLSPVQPLLEINMLSALEMQKRYKELDKHVY